MEISLDKYSHLYTVSDEGKIFSLKGSKKELIGKVSNSGYRQILINHLGKRDYLLVHILIAKTFIPNKFNKRTVNHKDGNKLNNHVSNLEWMTDRENLIHARDNGLLSIVKITYELAEMIRNDVGSNRFLSKKYNIGKTEVGYMKQNKRWKK